MIAAEGESEELRSEQLTPVPPPLLSESACRICVAFRNTFDKQKATAITTLKSTSLNVTLSTVKFLT